MHAQRPKNSENDEEEGSECESMAIRKKPAGASQGKIFPAVVEKEITDFLAKHGVEVNQVEVSGPTILPRCGVARIEGNFVQIVEQAKPSFGSPVGLNFTLTPEGVPTTRKRKHPASGLIEAPMEVQKVGTIRRYGATHMAASALSKRGCRDLPNVIFFSDAYRSHMESLKLPRGRWVNPILAERIMGFPQNWTSLEKRAITGTHVNKANKFPAASLFSGVAGIELGLADALHTVLPCDSDRHAVAVLRKLQKENVIPECPIVPDVALLTPEHMKSVKFLTAGFPCPDIGISGPKLGFTGDRSALFAWLVKAAAMAPD